MMNLINICRCLIAGSGFLQAFFSVVHPTVPSVICPAPHNLQRSLFEWNAYTTPLALMSIMGAILRMTAYAQLGSDFTYQLARPSGLVTDGVYKYVSLHT